MALPLMPFQLAYHLPLSDNIEEVHTYVNACLTANRALPPAACWGPLLSSPAHY